MRPAPASKRTCVAAAVVGALTLLAPRMAGAEAESLIRVRLQDGAGQPVVGARIPVAGDSVLSDARGEFAIKPTDALARVRIEITADGLAPAAHWLVAGPEVQVLELGIGGVIAGAVVKNGQPLAGVRIGLQQRWSQDQRSMESFNNWRFELTTDESGRFRFEHLPPNTAWQLFGVIESLRGAGALPPRSVNTSGHGSKLDLGEIQPIPALTLAGRLVPVQGFELPRTPIRIQLSYDYATTALNVPVASDGTFRFEGLNAGLVMLRLSSVALRPTPWNGSFDQGNDLLVGLFKGTKTNLTIEVGPGPYRPDLNYDPAGLPATDLPRNREIQGIEGLADGVRVSGIVVDDATGEPLPQMEVLPGRQPPLGVRPRQPFIQKLAAVFRDPITPIAELPYWQTSRVQRVTSNVFDVRFEVLASEPLLQIMAPGYEPMVIGPITTSTNGLVVRLPAAPAFGGVVTDATGRPAGGAKVIYAAAHESYGLRYTGELMEWGNQKARVVTDEAGRFTLPPRLNGQRVFIGHPAGWAMIDASDLRTKMQVTLEPWAVVTGRLVDTNGAPVVNEGLRLDIDAAWATAGQPGMSIMNNVKTGPDGRFWFTNIPPADLLLSRHTKLQTRFYASPGVTNELGTVTLDTPPPEPLLRRLKHKVGL